VEGFRNSASPFAQSVNFTMGEQFRTLSENMTIAVWNRMIDYFRNVDFSAFDGVIVAHGTDTLAYSASMFALLLAGLDVPVIFASSNAPLEHGDARANGAANFRAAVECIGYGIAPGVYATYRNVTDGRTYLHMGARLKQCADYSEDFHSAGALDITRLSPETLCGFPDSLPLARPLLYLPDLSPLSDCVLNIRPYVGIRYDAYRVENFRAVLHGTYHSGTACVSADGSGSILRLLDACADAGTDLYLSPARNQGEVYDTVPAMLNYSRNGRKIIPLYGMTEEAAYCKLLLYYSCGAIRERLPDFLTCDFCGEMVE
jgi:L-asparaginase